MRLEHLTCHACGASVPLAAGTAATCVYCSAAVPIPVPYQQMRDARYLDDAAEQEARNAFASVGKRPSVALRMFAGFTLRWAVFGGLLYLIAGAIIVRGLFVGIADSMHISLHDYFGARERNFMIVGASLFVAATLTVFSAFGRRRAVDTRALHTAMAARPPARPGGPATCRECGAPLTVAPGDLGVRCAYCTTDNLVAIDSRWTHAVTTASTGVFQHVRQALDAHRKELSLRKRRLLLTLGVTGVLGALVAGTLGRNLGSTMRDALQGERQLVDRPPTRVHGPAPVVAPTITIGSCDNTTAIDPKGMECIALSRHKCWFGHFVALRHGESVELRTTAAKTVRAELYQHRPNMEWSGINAKATSWGNLVDASDIKPDAPAKLSAPMTAWYRVHVALPFKPSSPYPFCARIIVNGDG
jgi:LSD1 subclass zinc finger protein